MQIHLIPNAHLDPVWLWDWREGMNEGVTTVKTILDLMDEFESLTFVRGESAIYEHIEITDTNTFNRILQRYEEGRWDVIGGTYVQPDTNLPAAETLARQYTRGQRYFESRFGRRVRVGWQADSFGHAAGLPEIMAAAGIEYFAFTRPENKLMPLAEPAFWWEGDGGSRILSYRPAKGWYGTNRDDMRERLDTILKNAQGSALKTNACFFGLGNHGGGPSRQQLKEIAVWTAEHPEVEVIFSGFHRFFDTLKAELADNAEAVLPVLKGELNYCLRGCYSTVAKFKYLYRRGENLLSRAEKIDSAVSALTETSPSDLSEAWDGILFNSFHDILPGSSIERAMEDQIAWMGGVVHRSQEAELAALNRLALRVDTQVQAPPDDHPSAVAALVWNPHPRAFSGHIEVEACLDYRPIEKYRDRVKELPLRVLGPDGEQLPFQEIGEENRSVMGGVPWRKRVLVPVNLPACGWNVLEFGWVEGARPLEIKDAVCSGIDWIDNGEYRVSARVGENGVQVHLDGVSVFGEEGITTRVYEDPWGSWGGMGEEPDSIYLRDLREVWKISQVQVLESGPERATLWVRLKGRTSRLDLSLSVCRGRREVSISARAFVDERSSRLKLSFPGCEEADFEVPGSVVRRGAVGEVPGGRWVRGHSRTGGFGLVSDALYNFDCAEGALRATITRASRYADDVKTSADELPWIPASDAGELKFRLVIAPGNADLPRIAENLEQPPAVVLVTPRIGLLPRSGSSVSVYPESVRMLGLKEAEGGEGYVIRLQAPREFKGEVVLDWLGQKIGLGVLPGGRIASWSLRGGKDGWTARATDLTESNLEAAEKDTAGLKTILQPV